MREEIVKLLKSRDRGERMRGWRASHADCAQNHYELPREDRIFLAQRLREEVDDGVQQFGSRILLELIALARPIGIPPESPAPGPSPRPLQFLYQWLWDPFHENSAMFGTASDVYLRDGMALVALARRLGWDEFPRAEIVLVPVGQPRWEEVLHQQGFQAIFLVGRLGLFGDEAVRSWDFLDSRFFFPKQQRSPGSAPDAFDPEYYCIRERLEDGRIESYPVHDAAKDMRTDFALIQRYPVVYLGVQIVVVLCAGCTSLGTLAAAQWAASHLTRNTHPQGTPIPCPAGLAADSRMEALLEVTADLNHPLWIPSRVELRRLMVDRATWNPQLRAWESESLIEVHCEGGDPQRPVAVVIDGKEERMDPKGQAFQLSVAVCLSAAENQGLVDLAKLLQSPKLWPRGGANEDKLRDRLSGLKFRHLKMLSIDREVRLHATVKIVAVEPVTAPVDGPRRKGRKPGGDPPSSSRKPR
jgi:hypothetical protein